MEISPVENYSGMDIYRYKVISHLRVTIKENVPLLVVKKREPIEIDGPLAFLMTYLSSQLNFSYSLMEPSDRQAGMKMGNGNWTGSFGLIQRNEADFYLGTVAVSLQRSEVLDFTSTFISFQRMFLVAQLGKRSQSYFSVFQAFEFKVFVYLFVVFQALVLLLSIFGYLSNDANLKSARLNFWTLLVIFLGHATQEYRFKTTSSRRLVWISWMLFSFVFTTFFSGALVSKMTVHIAEKFIESIDDFLLFPKVWPVVKAGQVDVDILKSTQGVAYQEVQRRLKSNHNPLGILKSKQIFDKPKVLKMINEGEAAFGSNLLNFKLLLDKHHDLLGTNTCQYQLTEPYAYTVNALGFRKGIPQTFIALVSDRLQRVVNAGLSYYIYPPQLNQYKRCLHHAKAKQLYNALDLLDFAGPLFTLSFGVLFSIAVFLVEITINFIFTKLRMIYWETQQRQRSESFQKRVFVKLSKGTFEEEITVDDIESIDCVENLN